MGNLATAIHAAINDGAISTGTLIADLSDCMEILSPKYLDGDIDEYIIQYRDTKRVIDVFSLPQDMGVILAFPFGVPEEKYRKIRNDLKSCIAPSYVKEIIVRESPPDFMYDHLNKLSTPKKERSWAGCTLIVWCKTAK